MYKGSKRTACEVRAMQNAVYKAKPVEYVLPTMRPNDTIQNRMGETGDLSNAKNEGR